jgi:hyperosmotically inducible periplasmic protein
MKNRQSIASLIAAAALAMASAGAVNAQNSPPADAPNAAMPAPGAAADDATITKSVKAALAEDKELQALKLNVSTAQGVVKISGMVPSADVSKRATQIAATVPGVKDVKSDLKVKG